MSERRVVITGIGTANPLGFDFASTSESLLRGDSGVRPVVRFDASHHPSRIAGLLAALPRPRDTTDDELDTLSPYQRVLTWCASEALIDSGLWDDRQASRIGLLLGLGAEYLPTWEEELRRRDAGSPEPPECPGLTKWLFRRLQLRGPYTTVAAACASGNVAMGLGRTWIRNGILDYCLAGAADCSVTPMGMAGFCNLGALSKRNDSPAAASRPFDRDRDGFVMSEGGAIYVLESLDSARRRGAKIYAEIVGFGASSDAYHLMVPSSDPGPSAKAIRSALGDAKLNPEEIDYLNAHATSTAVGDPFESRAIEAVFGESMRSLPVSATKSMTGHMLSAAAAVEVLACLTAFEKQAVPPTINLENVDPACAGLRHVPNQAEEHRVKVALSNSFGFGGSNTCLILRKAA
jgi:3-oxoacyl-[acyl-carrier-protein] synthase II